MFGSVGLLPCGVSLLLDRYWPRKRYTKISLYFLKPILSSTIIVVDNDVFILIGRQSSMFGSGSVVLLPCMYLLMD